MSDDIREQPPADDDIPVLTDIVVPGRLQTAVPAAGDARSAEADFVFDIDFEGGERRLGLAPLPASVPFPATTPVSTPPAQEPDPAADSDLDLPLPWIEPAPGPEPLTRRDEAEPLITAALAKAAAASVEPPDADAQLLLRELLSEIGDGLERRLTQEMADTERRLRAALREELDTRLRELLAGTPPNT